MNNYALKTNNKTKIVSYDFILDENYRQGSTWEAVQQGDTWVKLSEEQEAFYAANPTASVKEVWDMELIPKPVIDELQEAKDRKLHEISMYDSSPVVNSFTISGQQMWLSREERAALLNRCAAEEAAGITETTVWTNTNPPFALTLSITDARAMLLQIEYYAAQSFDVTQSHKAAVASLSTVEEIVAYDYRAGYPARLEL